MYTDAHMLWYSPATCRSTSTVILRACAA